MDLPEHIKLSLLDHSQASEQVLLASSKIVFGDLIQLEAHLQLEELLLDDGFVVQFPVNDFFDLGQYEFEAGERREQQVVDQEHKLLLQDGLGAGLAALELEANVNEVIGRPGPAILECELAVIPRRDFLHFLIEFAFGFSLNEKRRVHNHLVAYRLIGPGGDGGVTKDRIDFSNIGIRLFGES